MLWRNILAAAVLALGWLPHAAAEGWPSKPLRFIVAFPPGGPSDIIARLVAQKFGAILSQQIIVDNRTGAGGNIGAAAAAKAPPDGYTVLVTSSAIAVNASLFPDAGYDAERDFIPIGAVATQPNMIVVNASMPVKSLAELFDLAKTAKLAFASPGSGTTPHLTGENIFRVLAKLDITTIHFRGGGPAVAAVVAGEPPIGCMAISGPLPYVRSGKLRALAVSSAQRIAALPEVPTLPELGFPSVQDYTWVGLFAPAGTPGELVHKLNDALNRALQAPDVRERLDQLAFAPVGGPQREFADYVKAEIVKWAKVVKDTGAKPD